MSMGLVFRTRTIIEIDHDHCAAETREERLAVGLSVRECARRAGISAMHLSNLERGKRKWTEETYWKIHDAIMAEWKAKEAKP